MSYLDPQRWGDVDSGGNALDWSTRKGKLLYPAYEMLRLALCERVGGDPETYLGGSRGSGQIYSSGWKAAFQNAISAAIPTYVNHTTTSLPLTADPDLWTEATLLAVLGESRVPAPRLFLAEWSGQQYRILNLLRWKKQNLALDYDSQYDYWDVVMTRGWQIVGGQIFFAPGRMDINWDRGSELFFIVDNPAVNSRWEWVVKGFLRDVGPLFGGGAWTPGPYPPNWLGNFQAWVQNSSDATVKAYQAEIMRRTASISTSNPLPTNADSTMWSYTTIEEPVDHVDPASNLINPPGLGGTIIVDDGYTNWKEGELPWEPSEAKSLLLHRSDFPLDTEPAWYEIADTGGNWVYICGGERSINVDAKALIVIFRYDIIKGFQFLDK